MVLALGEPVRRYTRVAAALHWVVAVLIIVNVILGLSADALREAWIRPAIDLHKSTGLIVLGLVLLRIFWRLSHPAPPFPRAYSRGERVLAHTVHLGLYGLILLLPVSGWLHDSAYKDAAAHPLRIFWVFPWFRIGAVANLDAATKEAAHTSLYMVHVWSAYVLYALAGLHILGALKHQFIDGVPELQRMRIGHGPDD